MPFVSSDYHDANGVVTVGLSPLTNPVAIIDSSISQDRPNWQTVEGTDAHKKVKGR